MLVLQIDDIKKIIERIGYKEYIFKTYRCYRRGL